MRREDAIARLKAVEPALRACGVANLYLFGSHARDEAHHDSDVDVFVDPVPGTTFSFIPYMNAYQVIEAAIGRPVDYGTRNGLHPGLRHEIERNAIQVF